MEHLKTLIIKKFNTLSVVITIVLFSLVLLMVRIKLNQSFFYLFLIWNVFLALIPYAITMYLSVTKNKTPKFLFWFCIWLLFLPNAPYIITDFLHLRVSNSHLLWLDILVILSFAVTGLLLFYLSLKDMTTQVVFHFKKIPIKLITTVIIFLCAFGVYLGRFLRHNSWEIISQPLHLFNNITAMVVYPKANAEAWLFTFGFGWFLWVGYWVFDKLYELPST